MYSSVLVLHVCFMRCFSHITFVENLTIRILAFRTVLNFPISVLTCWSIYFSPKLTFHLWFSHHCLSLRTSIRLKFCSISLFPCCPVFPFMSHPSVPPSSFICCFICGLVCPTLVVSHTKLHAELDDTYVRFRYSSIFTIFMYPFVYIPIPCLLFSLFLLLFLTNRPHLPFLIRFTPRIYYGAPQLLRVFLHTSKPLCSSEIQLSSRRIDLNTLLLFLRPFK